MSKRQSRIPTILCICGVFVFFVLWTVGGVLITHAIRSQWVRLPALLLWAAFAAACGCLFFRLAARTNAKLHSGNRTKPE